MASPCGASRQTLVNYLKVLEETGAVHVIRPFAKNSQREITAMPKVYGVDTGFVCHAKGWKGLRPEDTGLLWEHLVLDELKARFAKGDIFYWRNKQKHELDFVVSQRSPRPVALECKWKLQNARRGNFASFLALYPEAKPVVVESDAGAPRINRAKGFVETGLGDLERAISVAMEMPGE